MFGKIKGLGRAYSEYQKTRKAEKAARSKLTPEQGGPTLTKKQQTLPTALKKKILMSKKKKKKSNYKSPIEKAVRT